MVSFIVSLETRSDFNFFLSEFAVNSSWVEYPP